MIWQKYLPGLEINFLIEKLISKKESDNLICVSIRLFKTKLPSLSKVSVMGSILTKRERVLSHSLQICVEFGFYLKLCWGPISKQVFCSLWQMCVELEFQNMSSVNPYKCVLSWNLDAFFVQCTCFWKLGFGQFS